MHRILPLFLLLTAMLTSGPVAAEDQGLLPQAQAFPLDAYRSDEGTIQLVLRVTPGYGIYRSKLTVAGRGTAVEALDAPAGELVVDPLMGRQRMYLEDTQVRVLSKAHDPAGELLEVTLQGCRVNVACYQPMRRLVHVRPIEGPK